MEDVVVAVAVAVLVALLAALASGKGVAEEAEAADDTIVPRITADAIGLIGWMDGWMYGGSVRLCSVSGRLFLRCFDDDACVFSINIVYASPITFKHG